MSIGDVLLIEGLKTLVVESIKNWLSRHKTAEPDTPKDEESLFSRYLEAKYTYLSTTKTFFMTGIPLPLSDIYEPMDVKCPVYVDGTITYRKLQSFGLEHIKSISNAIVLSGTAGAGKTTMLKNLFIKAAESGLHLPIFIELRRIQHKQSFFDLINQEFRPYSDTIPIDYHRHLLQRGGLLVIADGFDELDNNNRSLILNEILSCLEQFPDNIYILSSRPDSRLHSISPFTILTSLPLRMEQSISLIKRLPATEEDKNRFIDYLSNENHPQFSSFIKNPLLLCIMFLTFLEAGTIEYRRSAFYNDAFLALYNRHDATKYGFVRKFSSSLDRMSLEQVCSRLAIQSFILEKRSFAEATLQSMVKKATSHLDQKPDTDQIIQDLLQTVCLLVRNGMEFTYSHRSFEEYFAARFICECESKKKYELVKRITKRSIRDTVCVQVLHELEPRLIEELIIMPAVRMIIGEARTPWEVVSFIFRNIRSEQLGGNGWSSDIPYENLGKYSDYVLYLMNELEVLFEDRPFGATVTPPNDKIIQTVNDLTLIGGMQVKSAKELSDLLPTFGPNFLKIIEYVMGISIAEVTWLCDIYNRMKERCSQQDSFVHDLLDI